MFTSLSHLESAITKVLSHHYPITSTEILEKIENKSDSHYSTAGLHRALKSLREKGILHKHGKYYQLRTDRLMDEKKAIQAVLDRYIEAQNYHIFQKQEAHYYFNTLSELDYFWNAVIEQWFNFYPQGKYGYWQKQPFPWFAAMHLDEERRVVRSICDRCQEFRTYSIDNVMTRELRHVYTEHENSRMFLVHEIKELNHAYAVFGDHIIETFHPPHIAKVLENLTTSFSNAILFSAIIALSAPGSYQVTITKDARKAERYREYLESLS